MTLVDTNGGAVPGQVDPEGTWTTSELLLPSTAYTLTVAVTGPDGTGTTSTSTFATLKPKITATSGLIPTGGVVGVDMPVIVQFASGVVTTAQRADVEKRVKVTTVPKQDRLPGARHHRRAGRALRITL